MINVRDYFGNHLYNQVQISPNGKNFAFISDLFGKLNVFVKAFDSEMNASKDASFITCETEDNIWSFSWVSPERIVYLKDTNGNLSFRLMGINIDGTNSTQLSKCDGITILGTRSENKIYITQNCRDRARSDVFSVDAFKENPELILENPGDIHQWIIGKDGVFGGVYYNGEIKGLKILKDEKFHTVFQCKATDELKVVKTGEEILLLTDANSEYIRLIKVIDSDNQELIHAKEGFDIHNIIWTKTGDLGGIVYYSDIKHVEFIDKELEATYDKIKAFYPESDIDMLSETNGKKLVKISSSNQPSKWGLWFADDNYVDEITAERPNDYYQMLGVKASINKGLPCYLTFPKNGRKNLATIILAHGGPFSRTYPEFKNRAQFLAGLGYLVMHVNFRGSTGYGKAYREAGFKTWASDIQDDIIKATKWLISERYADPKKIGILGTSFGGFSALWAVIRHRELFKCAIAINPVTDLLELAENPRPEDILLQEKFNLEMGHPIGDRELLISQSPINRWAEVKSPVFIAHSSDDTIVPKSHSDRFAEFLSSRDDFTYKTIEEDGHLVSDAQNRIDLFYEIELFLRKYL